MHSKIFRLSKASVHKKKSTNQIEAKYLSCWQSHLIENLRKFSKLEQKKKVRHAALKLNIEKALIHICFCVHAQTSRNEKTKQWIHCDFSIVK